MDRPENLIGWSTRCIRSDPGWISEAPPHKSQQDFNLEQSGRPDSNRRPPEPHSEQELGQIRQHVAFTRCSGHRCRIWKPHGEQAVVRNSQQNSQHERSSAALRGSRVIRGAPGKRAGEMRDRKRDYTLNQYRTTPTRLETPVCTRFHYYRHHRHHRLQL